ncbi:MAG: hypothetical protein ACI360_00960 [Atopobiaceae bacterium]
MHHVGELVTADVDGQMLLGRVERVLDGALEDGQPVYDVAFERMTLHGMLDKELAPATQEQVGAALLGLRSGEGLLGMMGQVADGVAGQAELLRDAYLRRRYLELLSGVAMPGTSGPSAHADRVGASGQSTHADDTGVPVSSGVPGSDVLSQVEPWVGLPAKGARVRFAVGAGSAASGAADAGSAASGAADAGWPTTSDFYGVMDGTWESSMGERFASVKVLGGTCLVPPEQLEACPESQSQPARFAVGERARYVSDGHAGDPEFVGTVVSVALRPTNEWAYDLQFDDGYTLEQLDADELARV